MTATENDPLKAAAEKAFTAPFGAVLKIAPEDGGPLFVDGRKTPPAICTSAPEGDEASCQWRGAREALIRVMSSARAFESAYVSGRITVSGDMSVMARVKLEESR